MQTLILKASVGFISVFKHKEMIALSNTSFQCRTDVVNSKLVALETQRQRILAQLKVSGSVFVIIPGHSFASITVAKNQTNIFQMCFEVSHFPVD